MNEEQRAVLAAIHRMEESPGTLIDEYTVARAAGILPTELNGHEYLQSAVRAQIHQLFDELDVLGLIRLDREGYWRPRTTLSGRRSLQRPLVALPPQRPTLVPATVDESAASASAAATGFGEGGDELPVARSSRWPTWWPVALRFGDPALTPIIAPVALVLAILLLVVVVTQIRAGGQAAATATAAAGAASTATVVASQLPPTPAPTAPGVVPTPPGGAATPRQPTPTRAPTGPTADTRPPTPTAGPAATQVRVANTENKGAFVYVTPAGERRFAIPEGFVLDVIGPDQRDSKGNNWKHIRYLDFEGWIPEEYTTPVN
jgi:hypothetical protein